MWAVFSVLIDGRTFAYRSSRGDPMMRKSASLFGLGRCVRSAWLVLGLLFRGWAWGWFVGGMGRVGLSRDCICGESHGCDVQRFDVKDHPTMGVQLESLILAQNERWRQA